MIDTKVLAGMNNEVWQAYMAVVDASTKGTPSAHEVASGVLMDRMAQALMLLMDKAITHEK